MSGDSLKVVPDERMDDLIHNLQKDTPHSLHGEGLVKNVISWRKNRDIPNDYELYAPSADVKSEACIGIFDVLYETHISFHCLNEGYGALLDALLTTSLIDWGTEKKICVAHAISEKMMPIMEEIIEKKDLKLIFNIQTIRFWMKKERAINLRVQCPPGIEIRHLTPIMATNLDKYWPHRCEGSDIYLRNLLRRNFGIGVFIQNVEMPVAWLVLNEFSCMVMLYTLEAHRRKGYAELVCNAMAKKLAETGVVPSATVLTDNESSKKLFTKMGYLAGEYAYYLVFHKRFESSS